MSPSLVRVRRIDPWGPALAAASVAIFLLNGFGGLLTRDLALYAYSGQQFAEGVPPYVSVLNRAGPLAHIVPGFGAMLARALGTDDLMTMRALMMVLSVVAVWLTYLLGRDAFGSRAAGVTAVATLLTFQGFVSYATGGPREKTTMMLLVVIALLAVVHRRWALAGVAVALATLTWQPAFFVGTTTALVAALGLPWRERWRAWIGFGLGGVAATAVVTAYFALEGALPELVEGFWSVNASHTRQTSLVKFLWVDAGEMVDGFGWGLVLMVVGLVASVAVAVVARREPGPRDAARMAVIGMGAATVVAFLWSLVAFNGWADAVFVLPLAATGLAGLAALVTSRTGRPLATRAVAAYVVAALVATAIDTWVTRPDDLRPMRAETEAALDAAGPGVSVLSVGAPQPLVFGQLRNPLRHQMFIAGLQDYLDDTLPGGLEGLVSVVESDRPTFVTMDHPSWYPWFEPLLEQHYRRVGTTQEFTWYVDTTVGEERIARLTRILAGDPPES